MSRVRIFLCTYRRPQLLRRAVASLLAQTFTDWVCELHNDAPDDDAPRLILAELAPGDSRFSYHRHERNWGAVATINHAYAGGPEPFASLLEDDNWWEPGFLHAAVAALNGHPSAALAWANMRLWAEQPDAAWRDTGKTIWARDPTTPILRRFLWPEAIQAIDALHSHGAMVFRPAAFQVPGVPPGTPLAVIEHLRERSARGELLLLTEPLANFALTLTTARSDDRNLWLQSKLLVAASFFSAVDLTDQTLSRLWESRRAAQPRDTGLLFFTAFALRSPRLLRHARFDDALAFVLGCIRHPVSAWRGLRYRADHPELWSWLATQSERDPSPRPIARCTVLDKNPR